MEKLLIRLILSIILIFVFIFIVGLMVKLIHPDAAKNWFVMSALGLFFAFLFRWVVSKRSDNFLDKLVDLFVQYTSKSLEEEKMKEVCDLTSDKEIKSPSYREDLGLLVRFGVKSTIIFILVIIGYFIISPYENCTRAGLTPSRCFVVTSW